ncbi:MAG: hypothetical protein IJJ23_09845 [Clostridia bacterium]|nr:hypothetical protein [Clostridia bacterium]
MIDIKDANRRMIDELSRQSERYQESIACQREVFYHRRVGVQPLLLTSQRLEPFADLHPFTYKEIHYDPEKMLFNGLLDALCAQAGGRECVPSVRANMGCGIVPALFGLVQELFDDKMPWLQKHLSPEQIREMSKADITLTPEFQMALRHMEYMTDALKGSGVRVYPVDIQGAFDTAHLVMGDEIFYQMFDDPDLVHHLLDLSCDAIQIAFDECLKRIPDSQHTVCHYNYLAIPRALGGLKLSEDTPTILSPSAIDEFVKPYMHRALESAGGGYIHYCGRNDALFQAVMEEPYAHGLNFGNPEKHDMEQILRQCAAHKKLYIGPVPGNPDESPDAFIRRVLDASVSDGKSCLFLTTSVSRDQVHAFSSAWDRACESALQIV